MRKRDRRQTIVDAARKSFLEDGYAATSMSGLLTTLGGSKATLWSYFHSKEELFAAVIEDVTTSFRTELQEGLALTEDLEATLISFCRGFMSKICAPEAVATWRLVVAESGRFPEIGEIFFERAVRPTQAALARFLAHHVALGALVPKDAATMAEMLTSQCVGQQSRQLWGIASPNSAELEQRAVEFTWCFLRAYRAERRT
ncbi:TetR/AcrR family transcriptional regulator [Sphingosinicellaceae bacterium]|nr:TetR/AcrR family transcriptional regulator [Sphingosinicellaceae bacterium]